MSATLVKKKNEMKSLFIFYMYKRKINIVVARTKKFWYVFDASIANKDCKFLSLLCLQFIYYNFYLFIYLLIDSAKFLQICYLLLIYVL